MLFQIFAPESGSEAVEIVDMTNDAKLGLVVGVGLVIVVAVMFFRKDLEPTGDLTEDANVTVTTSGPKPRTLKAQPTSRQKVRAGIQHHARPGDSLAGLADLYYGDSARALEIFEANRAVFVNPDVVPPGAVLFIPEPTHAAPVLLPN